MRKMLFIIVVLLYAAEATPQDKAPNTAANLMVQSHCTNPADEIAIRQIAEQWKNGYNNAEAVKVASLYTEDAYYLTQHFVTGIVHGRAAIQAYVQRGADAGYHIDSIQVVKMACSGDFAYSVGRYDATNAGQKAFGVNIVVLHKIGGRWRIVAHESAVPDPATAIQRLDTPPTD